MPFILSVFRLIAFRIMNIIARAAGGVPDLNRNGLVITRRPTPICTNCLVLSPEMPKRFWSSPLSATNPKITNIKTKNVIHSEGKICNTGTLTSHLLWISLLHFQSFFKKFANITTENTEEDSISVSATIKA